MYSNTKFLTDMKRKRYGKITRRLFAAGAVMAALVFPQKVFAEPATVKSVVEHAINTNPEVQAKFHDFRSVYYEERGAAGGYFPKIDVSAGIGKEWIYQEKTPLKDDYFRKGVRVELTQMLFDGFYTHHQVCRLKCHGKSLYFEFLDSMEKVGLEALRAYADVLRYRTLVRLAEQNYEYHQEIYEQISSRVRQGVSTGVDQEQIEGRLALANSNLITERANLHDVTARYQRIIGKLPPEELTEFEVPVKTIPTYVEKALYDAYQKNPGFLATLMEIESSHHAVGVQKSKFYPRFDFHAYHDWSWDKDGIDGYQREAAVELVMTYNILNGGSDLAAVKQYKQKLYEATAVRDKAGRELRQTVEIAYNDRKSLNTQVQFLDEHRKRIDQVRVAYLDQFSIGRRTLLDLLDTENEYYQAQRAYINGTYDLTLADARTLAGIGNLLREMDIVRYDLPTLEDLDYGSWPAAAKEDFPSPIEAPKGSVN